MIRDYDVTRLDQWNQSNQECQLRQLYKSTILELELEGLISSSILIGNIGNSARTMDLGHASVWRFRLNFGHLKLQEDTMYGRVRFNRYNQMLGFGTHKKRETQLFWMSDSVRMASQISKVSSSKERWPWGRSRADFAWQRTSGCVARKHCRLKLPGHCSFHILQYVSLIFFPSLPCFSYLFFTDNLRPILPRTNLGKETVV